MKLRPYPKYKDSGIEWLGKIPEEWEFKKLKHLLRKKITDGPHETPEFIDEGIPFLSVDSIQDGKLIFENCRYISKDVHIRYKKKCNPEKYDVLMGKAASIGKIAIVNVDFEFSVWSPLALLKPNENILEAKFMEYALKSNYSQYQINIFSTLNTQQNISMDDIKDLSLVIPSKPEQSLIISYLDHKTSKIDELIKKNERLVELLKEKRQAIISQAVTKGLPAAAAAQAGLDPNVKMKDSGIEWLGERPETWNTLPLKQIIHHKVIKGNSKELPFLSLEHIVSGEGRLINGCELESVLANEYATFEKGDVLFGKLRPYLKKYYKVNFTGCCPTELMVFSVKKSIIDSNYLFYLVQSNYFISLTEATSYGAKMPRTSWVAISPKYVPIPSISEQRAVVKFLNNKAERINFALSKIRTQIEQLKEYRQTIISNVVTGKVRVSDTA
jgi:restriction endonuclease S subunit